MPKFFYLLTILIVSNFATAQNQINLKGRILDGNTKLPIESATVYITSLKDSSVVDYTITNKLGHFSIRLKNPQNSSKLKISFISYQDYVVDLTSLKSDKDFGDIELQDAVNMLDEVIVKSEIPPIRIKKDTLEFNASSFKVGDDANVEKLLEQLPGVEISPEGEITVNGKAVNNILVNGKPFFGKDGKVATQNLPANIIDKIQVVDTKSKSEEISGDASSSKDKTINLTISEEKNKGFFGKIMGGYGSSDRYESSLLLNYFKGEQKISLLASSNNINSVGFSMDEIFDNMSGGRNRSLFMNDNGSFGVNNMRFGGGTGITKSNMIGVNYQDKFFKKVDQNGSYYFTNSSSENVNKTNTINLLPTGKTFTNSNSKTLNESNGHNLSLDFEIAIDSTTNVYLNPSFQKSNQFGKNSGNRVTFNEFNEQLNSSNNENYEDNESSVFALESSFSKQFKKKRRGLVVNFNTQLQKQNEYSNTKSSTIFADATPDDIRDQVRYGIANNDNFKLEVRYGEPLTDSLRLSLTSELNISKTRDQNKTYNFDGITNDYTNLNELQSNFTATKTASYFISTGLIIDKSKTNGRLNFGPQFINFIADSDYLNVKSNLNKTYVFPKITGYLNHMLDKSKSIYANYNFDVNLPSAFQILPVEYLSDPLNVISGNENLKPTKSNDAYFSFNNYDYQSRSGFYIYAGFTIRTDDIVTSSVYNPDNFKSETTYENVDFSNNSYLGFSASKSYKNENKTLRYSYGISGNQSFSQGLTNNTLYKSMTYSLNPRVSLNYKIDDIITFAPSYRYTYSKTNYDNFQLDKADNFVHNAKLEITTYVPKKVVFGSDFGYTYNSNIANGFKKDFYLWNISLGYNFYNDQFLAKVKVYDLLNQNISTRRTITPTAIIDTDNTVLRRYVMFSLTYKLEKFAGKKKNSDMFFEH
jgi:hypothetical protein